MSGVDNVNNVGGGALPANNNNNIQNKAQEKSPSVFMDKNNNGVVDKSDFSDMDTALLAEEKGLIGKTWDSIKDSIDKLMGNNKPEPLSQSAIEARNYRIQSLKENNVDFTEHPDGTIEYCEDGIQYKFKYSGNNQILEANYPNNVSINSVDNLDTQDGTTTISDETRGLYQEYKRNEQGNITAVNYTKDENGNLVEKEGFMFSTFGSFDANANPNIYTASELAKKMNEPDFDPEKFFKTGFYEVINIGQYRLGGYHVDMSDGTSISVDPIGNTDEKKISIVLHSSNKGYAGTFNSKGEVIKESFLEW